MKSLNMEDLLVADEIQGLSLQEKQDAESLLLDLASSSGADDAQLLEHTDRFVASFGDGESTSMVTRFLRNIRKLTEVLSEEGGMVSRAEDMGQRSSALCPIK